MNEIPSSARLHEIIEDRLEQATGEPRHVTDIEIDFSPEQDDDRNWSVNAKCKREYMAELFSVIDQVETDFPVINFA